MDIGQVFFSVRPNLVTSLTSFLLPRQCLTVETIFPKIRQCVCVCVCVCVCTQSLSHVWLFVTPWTVVQPIRLLCPWDFPGRKTGVGCRFLLQGIFPTQRSNPLLLCLLHWQADSLPLSHLGNPPNQTVIHPIDIT